VLKDLVELYPGDLLCGSTSTAYNCVVEKTKALLKAPGGRTLAARFVSRAERVAARLEREFPGRYVETKRTIAAHIVQARALVEGRRP
jgi:hypothetical protein